MNEYIKEKWTHIFQKALSDINVKDYENCMLSDINAKDYETCMQCTAVNIVFTKGEVYQILAILEEASGERKSDD